MTRLPAFLGALRRDMPWPLLAAPLLFFAAFFAFPLAVVLVASATAADGGGFAAIGIAVGGALHMTRRCRGRRK